MAKTDLDCPGDAIEDVPGPTFEHTRLNPGTESWHKTHGIDSRVQGYVTIAAVDRE